MCFSAAVSFTSGTILSSLGTGAALRTQSKREIPFTLIPLVFGVQQFIEGFLWLAIGKNSSQVVPFTYIFLFFALLWWPLYIPFVAYALEMNEKRKKIIMLFGLIGLGVGTALYLIFLKNPATAQIVNRCVFYPLTIPHWAWFAGLYGLATLGPGLVSSNSRMRLFCALLFVFGLLAWFAYRVNFISVWCFFAAILSLIIFFSQNSVAERHWPQA